MFFTHTSCIDLCHCKITIYCGPAPYNLPTILFLSINDFSYWYTMIPLYCRMTHITCLSITYSAARRAYRSPSLLCSGHINTLDFLTLNVTAWSSGCSLSSSCLLWVPAEFRRVGLRDLPFNKLIRQWEGRALEQQCEWVSEWVSSFLTAHQHILGYLVPYNDVENTVKEIRYNQGYLVWTARQSCNWWNRK